MKTCHPATDPVADDVTPLTMSHDSWIASQELMSALTAVAHSLFTRVQTHVDLTYVHLSNSQT